MHKHPSRIGTVALVVKAHESGFELLESLSDDQEIQVLERALESGAGDPLDPVYHHREKVSSEDEEFANYVEELLSQPFLSPEIQEHAVKWLQSKMRIEEFQKSEREATEVIARFAFKVFQESPSRTDFLLAGPSSQVRVRIFPLNDTSVRRSA